MTRPARRGRATAATLLLVVALAAGACSSGAGDDSPAAAPSTSATPAVPAVRTAVTLGKVTGRLPRHDGARLRKQVGKVVDGWTTAAYVGGDYPRRSFSRSWPGFTRGAQEQARHDRALMSNQDIGWRIDGVRALRSRVRLEVLAVNRRAVGVTARVLLAFRTIGKLQRRVTVSGSLYLTHTDRGWQVFGYDISKGAR